MSSLRLSLRLRATLEAPREARHALEGLALYVGEECAETIELLVSELVTNSIRHADLTRDDMIEVIVSASDDTIRVEVGDPGRGFDEATTPATTDRGSGWGLMLTDRLARRWGVTDDEGARVWFEVAPRTPARGPTATSGRAGA